jgi:hypothetical protein
LEMWVLRTVCPGWSQTSILLISAYQVVRVLQAWTTRVKLIHGFYLY